MKEKNYMRKKNTRSVRVYLHNTYSFAYTPTPFAQNLHTVTLDMCYLIHSLNCRVIRASCTHVHTHQHLWTNNIIYGIFPPFFYRKRSLVEKIEEYATLATISIRNYHMLTIKIKLLYKQWVISLNCWKMSHSLIKKFWKICMLISAIYHVN